MVRFLNCTELKNVETNGLNLICKTHKKILFPISDKLFLLIIL